MVSYNSRLSDLKFDFKKNSHELKQLIMKMTMLRVWRDWNEKGKENSGYQTWEDVGKNLDKILDKKNMNAAGVETERDAEYFVKNLLYIYNRLGKESWVLSDFYYPLIECITGNDGDLLYYNKCTECKTIIIVDHGDNQCLYPTLCPVCCKLENYHWDYFTTDHKDYEQLIKWMDSDRFYWEHKWYRNYVSITIKIKSFFWKMFNYKKWREMRHEILKK